MQQQELGLVPVEVKDTWNQPRDIDFRRSFIENRLAAPALADIELDIDTELSMAA